MLVVLLSTMRLPDLSGLSLGGPPRAPAPRAAVAPVGAVGSGTNECTQASVECVKIVPDEYMFERLRELEGDETLELGRHRLSSEVTPESTTFLLGVPANALDEPVYRTFWQSSRWKWVKKWIGYKIRAGLYFETEKDDGKNVWARLPTTQEAVVTWRDILPASQKGEAEEPLTLKLRIQIGDFKPDQLVPRPAGLPDEIPPEQFAAYQKKAKEEEAEWFSRIEHEMKAVNALIIERALTALHILQRCGRDGGGSSGGSEDAVERVMTQAATQTQEAPRTLPESVQRVTELLEHNRNEFDTLLDDAEAKQQLQLVQEEARKRKRQRPEKEAAPGPAPPPGPLVPQGWTNEQLRDAIMEAMEGLDGDQ